MSFTSYRNIKKTRKAHCCEWCVGRIEIGSSCSDGYMHLECDHAYDIIVETIILKQSSYGSKS